MNHFLSDIRFERGIPVNVDVPVMLPFGRALLILAGSLSLALWVGNSPYAQEQNAQDADAQEVAEQETNDEVQIQPLPDKDVVRLDQMLADIVIQKEDLLTLEGQVSDSEGPLQLQITTLDRAKLTERIGALPATEIEGIEQGIHAACDLEP